MIDGQPLACFQPFIDTATGRIAGVEALGRVRQRDGRLTSVGPLFADPRTPAIALRQLDRQIRDNALSRFHEAPDDWFLSLNMSPRWINRLRANQALPSLKQLSRHGVESRRIVFEITELGGDIQRLPDGTSMGSFNTATTPPPVIDGLRKDAKPGGYSDGGADIGFALKGLGRTVVTPVPAPDPAQAMQWVFPDTADGIAAAIAAGADTIWANSVLFEGHPIEAVMGQVAIVGQTPAATQKYDDKFATNRMLETLPWPRHLKNVPEYAGGHHERMDGKGYPKGLKRDEMSWQARMMGIADIFEALTAADRPYKKAMPLSQALAIMRNFKEGGHIDPDLFDVFVNRQVYRRYAQAFLTPEQIDC